MPPDGQTDNIASPAAPFWRRKVFWLFLVVIALLAGDILIVRYRQTHDESLFVSASESDVTKNSMASPATLNAFAVRVAKSEPLAKCAPLADESTRSILPQGKTKVLVFPEKPGYLSFSAEIMQPTGAVSYASITVSRLDGGTCLAQVDITTHWIDGCDAVAEAIYPAYQPLRYLNKRIFVLKDKEEERVFLLPIAQGCLSVQKQLFQ